MNKTGKPITYQEALKISVQILENAEKERQKCNEDEAKRAAWFDENDGGDTNGNKTGNT